MIYFDYDVSLPNWDRGNFRKGTGKNQELLIEFLNSGRDIGEIRWADGDYKDYKSVQTTFIGSISTLGLSDKIAVKTRNGRVFLVRK